jgi:alpha-L-arabinofuranosidase
MIANKFSGTGASLNNPYFKRPNYYVFEMYHKHFGDVLINTDVTSDTYYANIVQPIKSLIKRIMTGTLVKNNLLSREWKIKKIEGVESIETNNILEVNFVNPSQVNYYHSIKTAKVEANSFYKLSGYIKSQGLIDTNGVCLEVADSRGWNKTRSTASTEKVKSTTDWQYVEVIYETLPDAKAVNVIARHIGENGPLKGKAYFRDVKLEEFIPALNAEVPYLSVNASKFSDGSKVYLMVINKNMNNSMIVTIDLRNFVPAAKGNSWVLNGPSVDATNEVKHDNVKITHKEFEIKGNAFEFTFEPHSLTAIEIERAK